MEVNAGEPRLVTLSAHDQLAVRRGPQPPSDVVAGHRGEDGLLGVECAVRDRVHLPLKGLLHEEVQVEVGRLELLPAATITSRDTFSQVSCGCCRFWWWLLLMLFTVCSIRPPFLPKPPLDISNSFESYFGLAFDCLFERS